MVMIIIGISGRKKSGKDTVANIITSCLPSLRVDKIAFADSLKEEVAKATGTSVEFIEKNKDNFRLILQGWGTDFRRKLCNENYWIARWLQKAKTSSAEIILAPDVRFLNEAEILKEVGGLLIRVNRTSSNIVDNHESEIAMDQYKYDYVIDNNGGLTDLKTGVIDFLNILNKGTLNNGHNTTVSRM